MVYLAISTPEISVSSDFMNMVVEKYGLIGLGLVGIIIIAVPAFKYFTKRLEADTARTTTEENIQKSLSKIEGIVEQMQRENNSHQQRVEESIEAIKKESAFNVTEISKLGQNFERENREVRRELSEIKQQVRDIQRDILYKERGH